MNMVTQFPLFVSSKLNFNILRTVYWLQGLKNLELHLALQTSSSQILLVLCKLSLTFSFLSWQRTYMGPQRMKIYLPCKKIYLSQMTRQHLFQPWVGIFFPAVSRVEVKYLQRSEKAHFLILQLCSKMLLAACAPHWPKNSLKTIPHKQAEGFFHPIFPRYTLIFTRQNSELSHLSTFLQRC